MPWLSWILIRNGEEDVGCDGKSEYLLDDVQQHLLHEQHVETTTNGRRKQRVVLASIFCLAITATIFLVVGQMAVGRFVPHKLPDTSCRSPRLRREWRSLSDADKLSYLNAVQCLHKLPSQVTTNATRYDDLPFLHQQIGYICEQIHVRVLRDH